MAARLCDIAQADTILVSRDLKDACTGADLVFEPTGSETLKGFSEPIQLFSPAH
jgi:class 3 adenylate cyclase